MTDLNIIITSIKNRTMGEFTLENLSYVEIMLVLAKMTEYNLINGTSGMDYDSDFSASVAYGYANVLTNRGYDTSIIEDVEKLNLRSESKINNHLKEKFGHQSYI